MIILKINKKLVNNFALGALNFFSSLFRPFSLSFCHGFVVGPRLRAPSRWPSWPSPSMFHGENLAYSRF